MNSAGHLPQARAHAVEQASELRFLLHVFGSLAFAAIEHSDELGNGGNKPLANRGIGQVRRIAPMAVDWLVGG